MGSPAPVWQAGRFRLELSVPRVMGIVNVTPDSFSDGGEHAEPDRAVAHARRLVEEGADILDIGGESTRPGAAPVTPEAEWARVEPVLRGVLELGVPVSVDTRRALVMERALALGADIINDVQALTGPGCLDAVRQHPRVGVCLMHMRGEPATMQQAVPEQGDVVQEVARYLRARADDLLANGFEPSRIVLDPGIGFGKTPGHNLELLRRQAELQELGFPLLAGWSRKSTLGLITGRPAAQRVAASVAAALLAVQAGAAIVRVHDVAATVDALKVWRALRETT